MLVGVWVAVGLSPACHDGGARCECAAEGDCSGDEICFACRCRLPCNTDYDCPSGEICARDNGVCLPGTPARDEPPLASDGGDPTGGDPTGGEPAGGEGTPGDVVAQDCECASGQVRTGAACGNGGTLRSECDGCAWGPFVCYGESSCTPTEANEETCGDGLDNDCDTLYDCADPDCLARPCGAAATVCSDADTCDGSGLCNPRHRPVGDEGNTVLGPCPVCQDCNGDGACANLASGTDVGCDAGATTCSAADSCANGICQDNDLSAGAQVTGCTVCQECNGDGACRDVASGQRPGCDGTCDSCSGGSCHDNTVTCYRDHDGDGYTVSGSATNFCGACAGDYRSSASGQADCNDESADQNHGAGFSTTVRDCPGGGWDCDCVAGVTLSPANACTGCESDEYSCYPVGCGPQTQAACGLTLVTGCEGSTMFNCSDVTATIGCK